MQNSGKPYGVPHHTDTSVILYNKDALAAAGVTLVPTTLEEAWTWDEFAQLAETLRKSLPSSKYPFAYNWQGNGVTRWLSWLFEADGRFLAEDLITPAIDSDAGRQAVEFTQSFFAKNFVPPNNSVKSTTYAADIWYSQTAAMTFGGAFLIPDAETTLDFEWGATFSPRKVRAGGDFGGNALVATKATPSTPSWPRRSWTSSPRPSPMRDFCAGASLLPTRARPGRERASSSPSGPSCRRSSSGRPRRSRPQRLRPGRLADDVQDHHRAQGPAGAGVRRRPERRRHRRRAVHGHRRPRPPVSPATMSVGR